MTVHVMQAARKAPAEGLQKCDKELHAASATHGLSFPLAVITKALAVHTDATLPEKVCSRTSASEKHGWHAQLSWPEAFSH